MQVNEQKGDIATVIWAEKAVIIKNFRGCI